MLYIFKVLFKHFIEKQLLIVFSLYIKKYFSNALSFHQAQPDAKASSDQSQEN